MKKWHLEGVCSRMTPRKLALPDPAQAELFRSVSFAKFPEESKIISFCRKIAAFFIRCL